MVSESLSLLVVLSVLLLVDSLEVGSLKSSGDKQLELLRGEIARLTIQVAWQRHLLEQEGGDAALDSAE